MKTLLLLSALLLPLNVFAVQNNIRFHSPAVSRHANVRIINNCSPMARYSRSRSVRNYLNKCKTRNIRRAGSSRVRVSLILGRDRARYRKSREIQKSTKLRKGQYDWRKWYSYRKAKSQRLRQR